jgi:Uma2 family endonuclease
VTPPAPPQPPPPLENGDRLTRDEFERRYNAMPWLKKAELIEGEVYMPYPVRWKHHGSPNTLFNTWMGTYVAYTPGVSAGGNATVRMDPENEPQPDGIMIIEPAYGGGSRIDPDDYLSGDPELLAEISASTVSIDLNKKFQVYRRNKVREYIVWRVQDAAIDWFVLRGEDFERLQPDAAGLCRSEVFPGLWLDAAAMIRGDLATVLEKLQEGIRSPEHAVFVAKLLEKASAS